MICKKRERGTYPILGLRLVVDIAHMRSCVSRQSWYFFHAIQEGGALNQNLNHCFVQFFFTMFGNQEERNMELYENNLQQTLIEEHLNPFCILKKQAVLNPVSSVVQSTCFRLQNCMKLIDCSSFYSRVFKALNSMRCVAESLD